MRYLAMTAGAIFIASSLVAAPPEAPNKEKLDSIGPRMQKFVDEGEISGAVCLVGRKEGVIHESAVGLRDIAARAPMQKDTLFKIASMTKPITAIGIMILADEGKLDPNDEVAKYLPEFTGQWMRSTFDISGLDVGRDKQLQQRPSRPIKLRDLLTHTSGVAPYPAGVNDVYVKRNRTLAETALATALQPLQFEPGTKWAYSNSGIDTLGRIIEVVSGQSYERFLQERVFDPLGMKDTTFFPTKDQLARLAVTYAKDKEGKLTPAPNSLIGLPPNAKHPIPAGGLISCTGDLAKLYRMMLSRGELNGKRILSEKADATMTQLQTGMIKTGFVEGMGFGYGWA